MPRSAASLAVRSISRITRSRKKGSIKPPQKTSRGDPSTHSLVADSLTVKVCTAKRRACREKAPWVDLCAAEAFVLLRYESLDLREECAPFVTGIGFGHGLGFSWRCVSRPISFVTGARGLASSASPASAASFSAIQEQAWLPKSVSIFA